ncbi:MAG TPA: A24 family peptidase [Pirellulaceae bacterium]|nr:A24 family peptidase [Pirellulaceae bacterium]
MHFGYDLAACVAVFTAACAVVDYRTKKIPNWLTVPAAAIGLAYHLLAPGGSGPLVALGGFAIGFGLLIVPWLLGGGGMGDVKMLAALGVWLGPLGILASFGLGAMLAAFGMIGVLIGSTFSDGFSATRKRFAHATASGASAAATPPKKARRVLPFAVPMALGTWLVLGWMLLKSHG